MNVSMNGRKVSHICWVLGAENSEEIARSDQHGRLELVATYHGDHDEFWIAQIRQDGVEVRRFNCKYLSYIAWEEPAQTSGEQCPECGWAKSQCECADQTTGEQS